MLGALLACLPTMDVLMLKRGSAGFICVLGSLLLGWSLSVQAERLILVGDEFCPYNCKDSGDYQGYMVDVLQRIFSEHGYTVEYHLVPWSRAIKMVVAGDADILLANTPANSLAPQLSYAMGVDSTCFFVRAGFDWRYSGLPSLEGVRLGVTQDYHYDDNGALDTYIRRHTSDQTRVVSSKGAHALMNNFNMLVAGRQDVLVENCDVGNSTIAQLELADKVINADKLLSYQDALQVSFAPGNAKSAQRLQLLKQGIERLRASHQLQPILDKYAVGDWLTEPAAELQP